MVETEGLPERLARCEALLEQLTAIVEDQQKLDEYQIRKNLWDDNQLSRVSAYKKIARCLLPPGTFIHR